MDKEYSDKTYTFTLKDAEGYTNKLFDRLLKDIPTRTIVETRDGRFELIEGYWVKVKNLNG